MTASDPASGPPRLDRRVADEEQGQRLDQLLTAWLGHARSQVADRITAGRVTVDGERPAKSLRVVSGMRVVVLADQPEPASPPADAVPIRWEDEHLAVVAKPAGLVVHRGAGTTGPTLVDALRAMGVPLAESDDPERPGVVHRLDRGTSGALVVAKTPVALAELQAMFKAHEVERVYWALVDGVPEAPRATIDAPIGRSTANRTRFAVAPGGRPALTHYDVTADHGRAAELRVTLETGRTHQVRVHLSAVGHPVAADRVYGAGGLGRELGLERPALHARRLGFTHPITGEGITVNEELPDDLARARALLREGS